MTHLTELALAAALVGALGVGAVVFLSVPQTRAWCSMSLRPVEAAIQRAEPMTNDERLARLERQLADAAVEQRRLIDHLNTVRRERTGNDLR